MRTRIALSLGTALALSACAVGPDYRPATGAALGVPGGYYGAANPAASDADLAQWWTRFNDPALNSLIDAAIANNLDIAQAQARLRQARESLVQSRAAFLPQVSGSAQGGQNYSNATGGSRTDNNGNVITQGANAFSGQYSARATASWEIDLFGGLSRSAEAARADLAASGYTLANTRVSIIAELVTNYVQARATQEQLRIARETLGTQQENFDIARWRVQAGLVSSLDQEQARAQLAQTTASIPSLESSLRASLNRIAVLTGQAPGEATRTLETAQPIPVGPADIATGVPGDTLRQRPDVRSAERTLAAATARIGVAEAKLYPSFNISANIGTSATTVGGLTDIITGGLFGNLAQVIFDGGTLRSQVRSQRAATDAAFAAYKATVLTALEDVENALAALKAAREREAQFAIALDASNNSALLARTQYQAGLTDFQTLLTAEQTLLSARNSLASAQSDAALAIVQLYRALGGGWQTMDGIPQ